MAALEEEQIAEEAERIVRAAADDTD